MAGYEYEVTKHSASEFIKVAYFCTAEGECSYDQLPSDQITVLQKILNDRGSTGWELVQIFFGKDGAVAIWKRDL